MIAFAGRPGRHRRRHGGPAAGTPLNAGPAAGRGGGGGAARADRPHRGPAAVGGAGSGGRAASLTIPVIGVKTNLITLGLASRRRDAGAVLDGGRGLVHRQPAAGSIGSAIIVGHVDSVTSRGVFYGLSQLKAGNDVFVKRADGTTAEFRVTEVQQYLKDKFPTQAVYGPTPDAELRLITCGGAFDPATHHYLSNIVVYATEVK